MEQADAPPSGIRDQRPDDDLRDRHVIVAGFGPIGRTAVQKLEDAGVQVTVIELNEQTIEHLLERQRQVVQGDVTRPDTLRAARIEQAQALILTIPDEEAAVAACRVARELNPGIFIAARTNFLSKGLLATQAGADEVVVEEVVTAEAMQRAVMGYLVPRPTRAAVPESGR
ncbi:MAG: NAD(P)-binding protein [Phycisphaeraceae bacterium]